MRRPMKEPRSPNEIYFLIQTSRNEKDLSRTEQREAFFFHRFLRFLLETDERKKKGDPNRRGMHAPRL